MLVQRQMPKYLCSKEVWALKIKGVKGNIDGSAILTPEDNTYGSIFVDSSFVKKHEPFSGGYYVVYKGGYQSFSPADIFESGYYRL